MPLSLALVGIGKIARDQHLPSIAADPRWQLTCTVSRNASVDGVPAYIDTAEMLKAEPGVEVVSLALPPVPRFQAAMAALAADRHVMLEKPPGMTLGECHALRAEAAARGLTLYASWHSRSAAAVPAAKAFLARNTLKSLQITWNEDVRKWHPGQDWVWNPGGMGVFDPGINALSILTEIVDAPLTLTRATIDVPANRQTPIAAELAFHHPGGARMGASLNWDWQGDDCWDIVAETDGGTLRLSEGGARMWIGADEQDVLGGNLANPLGTEYSGLYAHMADLVAAGTSDVDFSPFVLVAAAMMIAERREVAPFDW